MQEQMVGFFISGFYYPGLEVGQLLIAALLALGLGAAWFATYWTPVLKKAAAWGLLAGSALLAWTAISFVQIPFQSLASQGLLSLIGSDLFARGLLFAALPAILISGLVQEAAKMVPLFVYRRRMGGTLEPRQGLLLGAVCGLGLGVFEAFWVNATILGSGWTWSLVNQMGPVALLGFAERFSTVGLHIGLSAVAGWGLAKGKGWQAWLVVSAVHALANYGALLLAAKVMDPAQVEFWVFGWSVLAAGTALWLRWRRVEPVAATEQAGPLD
jgi:RsiW-degrading membrane proteinase PrsW (M82 family)